MTLFWFDYETWGRNPRQDRPVQFAGVRTDENLEPVAEPVVLHCRPSPDYLPHPEAVLIHGVSPSRAIDEGVTAAEFAGRIHEELAAPNTTNIAFNAIAFDREVVRHLFFRSLVDPYRWAWDKGCSCADIIDTVRAAFALRPQGIKWPKRDDGAPSFRLEDLAAANGIEHENAHDALQDVVALLGVARLLKDAQPRLFQYGLSLRSKDQVATIVREPYFFFASSFIPAKLGCGSLVAPLGRHPTNKNEVLVYDLRCDPRAFAELSASDIEALIFTRTEELPEDAVRPPIYRIKLNGCPFVAPASAVDETVLERLRLDLKECVRHLETLRAMSAFAANVRAAYDRDFEGEDQDVDSRLYDGFIPDGDRALLDNHLEEDVSLPTANSLSFADDRLPELVRRYRARSFWHTLSDDEKRSWHAHCRDRHLTPGEDGRTGMERYNDEIDRLRLGHAGDDEELEILDELAEYGRKLKEWLG